MSWFGSSGGRPPPIGRLAVLLVVTILFLCSIGSEARSPHPPPLRRLAHPEGSRLEILPRKLKGLQPRYTSSLPPHPSTLLHSDTVLLTLDLPDLLPFPASLLLRPSENIFHPDAKMTSAGGQFVQSLREEDWRLYTGEVVHPKWVDRMKALESIGARSGWDDEVAILGHARIMVHETGDGKDGAVFEGTFDLHGTTYNVVTKENYLRVKTAEDIDVEQLGSKMVVFRNTDIYHHENQTESTIHSCSHDSLPFNSDLSNPILRPSSNSPFGAMLPNLWRRDDTGGMTGSSNFINSINVTSGCPNTQQIVYMGVAIDCNYVSTYGSQDAARTQILNNWNQISALYKSTFNISLGIIELQVQNATCPTTAVQGEEWNVACTQNLTLDERLSTFSQWRGNKGDDGAGLWHLMSACPTDSEVGVAWLGTLCQNTASQQSGSTVSGTGISTATKTEWSLVAHEIGHGFGAIHDCTGSCSLSGTCCPLTQSSCDAGGRFIMNPTTSASEQSFSGCSLGNICTNLGNRAITTTCIQSPGSRTVISLQQCGNGIVEAGEDCDPGSGATSACCDPSTCKFRSGAVCDPANSACCTSTCQYASSGTVCRPAVDSTCDIAEVCSGNNATCPEDKTASDGTSCGASGAGLACASGTCTSLNTQCRNAGSSLGLSQACGQKDDTSCVVSCKDPNISNQCVVLQTPLVDGSPCGYGGHCYNSTCRAGSWQSTAGAWYKQNLQISIPVTIVAGLLVLAIVVAILRCIFRSCCGASSRRPPRNGRNSRVVGPTNSMYAPPPPPMSQLPPPLIGVQRNSVQRHSDSISSGDPLTRTGVIDRDPSPVSAQNVGGYDGYYNQQGGYLAPQGQQAMYGGGQGNNVYSQTGGWVDDRNYNGRYYGREQAYGR
ncbi:hypothetical protein CI109_101425 [Kwoniella shandongensis]|uniref:Disintegrin and metalloproteinase domain-containing protein B n=1 Tax=Kwoniella shandongensis TaxID=1734106 RepID=A0A5M6BYN1_9TREE|nr:uncharacterized protein CI109_005121 [Kwoniella shandongensis]KAA5526545.1 hypothetical protein CI109_005121 [Kwoniella shandongensis]